MSTQFLFARFCRSDRGAVAIIFALSSLPVIGAAGAALDYSSATNSKALLQQAVDAAALAGGKHARTDVRRASTEAERVFRAIASKIGDSAVPVVSVNPALGETTVRAAATVKTSIISVVGIDRIDIAATATASASGGNVLKAGRIAAQYLDSEAADYNRVIAYCYDHARRTDPDSGRTKFTRLFDNANNVYETIIPECNVNEGISFQFHNVICGRFDSSTWESTRMGVLLPKSGSDGCIEYGTRYNYFVDIRYDNSVMNLLTTSGLNIVETKLCSSLSECKSSKQGGIVPAGTNRNPVPENRACTPGKFMYFGFEDHLIGYHPNGDNDYDDISFVIQCPVVGPSETGAESVVRLVR